VNKTNLRMLSFQANRDMDISTKLPADLGAGYHYPQLVIGSLDLNIGSVLPAEELIGKLPEADSNTRRAYLSNVCVAGAAQRHGIAHTLMLTAEREARREGVQHLYVHVVGAL
jgi:ribosomal protein S18 acetylase RimI-like enzyme